MIYVLPVGILAFWFRFLSANRWGESVKPIVLWNKKLNWDQRRCAGISSHCWTGEGIPVLHGALISLTMLTECARLFLASCLPPTLAVIANTSWPLTVNARHCSQWHYISWFFLGNLWTFSRPLCLYSNEPSADFLGSIYTLRLSMISVAFYLDWEFLGARSVYIINSSYP